MLWKRYVAFFSTIILIFFTLWSLHGAYRPTAMGFFPVGRESMVGLFSTMVTYLIILIQFDQVNFFAWSKWPLSLFMTFPSRNSSTWFWALWFFSSVLPHISPRFVTDFFSNSLQICDDIQIRKSSPGSDTQEYGPFSSYGTLFYCYCSQVRLEVCYFTVLESFVVQ